MRVIDCEQGTEGWFAARLGIPTASEFSDIITPAKGDYSASAPKYIARLIDDIVRPGAREGLLVTLTQNAGTSSNLWRGSSTSSSGTRRLGRWVLC